MNVRIFIASVMNWASVYTLFRRSWGLPLRQPCQDRVANTPAGLSPFLLENVFVCASACVYLCVCVCVCVCVWRERERETNRQRSRLAGSQIEIDTHILARARTRDIPTV